jgi:REP element-mobilizing transposase RayT
MPTGYQIAEQDQLYFLTLQVVEWVDIFTRKEYRDLIITNLAFCQEHKSLEINAYVVMSNHIHILARSTSGELSNTIRDFKSYTSKELLKLIAASTESRREWMLKLFKMAAAKHKRNSAFQLWTHENHAEHIYSAKFMAQKINYIHENPVRAAIVSKAEDYLYSSARNYAGEQGLLQVTTIELNADSGGWKSGGWRTGGWNSGKWMKGGWNTVE